MVNLPYRNYEDWRCSLEAVRKSARNVSGNLLCSVISTKSSTWADCQPIWENAKRWTSPHAYAPLFAWRMGS